METALRVHTAVTAEAEKRLLTWLAERLPAAIGPDHLTLLGLTAQLGAGFCYAISAHSPAALWGANACLILNWFGDSLDGTVARVRNCQRPKYGYYVDHVVDAIGALALLAGVGASGCMHWPVATLLLIAFYLLAIESFLATQALGRFHVSHGFFGPTELRILLIAGNIALWLHPAAYMFDIAGCVAAIGMLLTFVIVTARHIGALRAAGK